MPREPATVRRERRGHNSEPGPKGKAYDRLIRGGLIVAGTIFVALGSIGIFVPLLPTTPFLLLAAACYARGSKKFYNWLLSNRWFGQYVRNYLEGRGIPLKTKILVILLLWLTIGYSAMFVIPLLVGKAVLVLIAVVITLHISSIKTSKEPPYSSQSNPID